MSNKCKKIYRLVPCPSYDVEGMESWLNDLAEYGLLLSKEGFYGEIAVFEKSQPCRMKYRLAASMKSTSMWAENYGEPGEEEIEISEQYGWEYIAKRGEFYIFCSRQSEQLELNTDPEVHALAVNEVRKRQHYAVYRSFLWLILYPILMLREEFWITMVKTGAFIYCYAAIVVLMLFCSSVRKAVGLNKLRKKILQGGMIGEEKSWRERHNKYLITNIIKTLLVVGGIFMILNLWSESMLEENKILLSDYAEIPPFATIKDFGEAEVEQYRSSSKILKSTVEEWQNMISAENYHWEEYASVDFADNTVINGSLEIDYHETFHEGFAEMLALEYHDRDKNKTHYFYMGCPDKELDYAAAYIDKYGFPTVVMQNGKKVIRASFVQYGEEILEIGEWAEKLSKCMKE